MSNKLLPLLLVIGALILSAMIARNGRLLTLAMPFLAYLLTGLLQAPGGIELSAHRSISRSSVTAGEPVEVRVVVENQGNALTNLLLDDPLFPAMFLHGGKARQRLSLRSGEITELGYTLRAARGVYAWNVIHASAADPFALFPVDREVPAREDLLVKPAPLKLRPLQLKPRSTLHTVGQTLARLAGTSTDFWGTREYRAGDSLQRLNWRMSARHPGRLFTNEYERQEIADFGLVLDARQLTQSASIEQALFEYSVRGAASISENVLKNGDRVSLLIFGETMTSLFPGYGKGQLSLIQWNLARVRLGSNLPLGYLEYFPVRLFPGRAIIVVFSIVDGRDQEAYARLRALGYDVLLVSPDPVDFAARLLSKTKRNTLAIRAARIERRILLQRLLGMGVQVIDWQVNQPLDTRLQGLLMQLARRRNI